MLIYLQINRNDSPGGGWFSNMHRRVIIETPVVNNDQREESESLDEKQSNHSSRLL